MTHAGHFLVPGRSISPKMQGDAPVFTTDVVGTPLATHEAQFAAPFYQL